MFDSTTFTTDMLSNPTKLSKAVIDAMEQSDTTDVVTINDPNNGFVLQLFANNCIFSKFSEKIDYVYSFFYPQRARNAEQLYPHLSQFDYVNLMASPATLPFIFAMSRDWVVLNSVYFDDNYNKIELPATSYITMGGVVYSMYHPIQILVNRNTGAVTAFYNTAVPNNLNILASNMLLDVQEFTQNGINYFQIKFNMYQFERKIISYTVGSEQGFIKTLTYDDQFYAVKIFTKNTVNEWVELNYSLTQLYYDFQTPTAILSLMTDSSQIKVQIPQIYFDNNQISQSIKVELYTTKGVVNYSLSSADVTGLTANFDTGSSVFAAPLAQMPTWTIIPTTLEVAGGSNVKTYQEIRDSVVNQRLHDRVAVTTPEVIEAGKKAGFDLVRVVDDLTERMYFASNILKDSSNFIVPTFAGYILIADESLSGNPSTIIDFTDGYYTILPTTTFTISNNSLMCVPMTDGQVAALSQITTSQLITELNKGIYVRQPFHITLTTAVKSPKSLVYNLLSPSMTSLTFIAENAHSAPQMSVTSCEVIHLENGTGGYQILLGITRSSNIVNVDSTVFDIYLTCLTKSGVFVYLPANYVSTDSRGIDTWNVQLSTSYHITVDDFISIMMYDTDDILNEVEIPLNQNFTVVTSFNSSFSPTIPIDQTLNSLLPTSVQALSTAMSQQIMKISLGYNLSNQIYCGVNTSWGNDVYQVADETIYYKTHVPVFQTTETGVINTRYNTDTNAVEVVILYQPESIPSQTQDLILKTTTNIPIPTSGATTTTYPVNNTTGLLVGMRGRGTNIPVNSKITAIGTNTVTMDKVITDILPSGTELTFTNPHILTRGRS